MPGQQCREIQSKSSNLVFVIVKGVIELVGWRAKRKVETIGSNGYDRCS
jgi:hypothetical protein